MQIKLPILYSFRRCPYAMRARIAIKLSNQTCELREINLHSKPTEFMEISQKGTVPVLVLTDGSIIDESLDIIKWAISKNDEFKLKSDKNEIEKSDDFLISLFDNVFKEHLDKYKYNSHYNNEDPLFHREKASEILFKVSNMLYKNKWLRGENPGVSDIAILPFVRQFRIADPDWFDNEFKLHKIKLWLNNFLISKMYLEVMEKFKPWEPGQNKILF